MGHGWKTDRTCRFLCRVRVPTVLRPRLDPFFNFKITEGSLKYALLIFETPATFEARSGKDRAVFWGAGKAYAEALKEAGVVVGGSGLEAPGPAATVRFGGRGRAVEDGPYADTKEQL